MFRVDWTGCEQGPGMISCEQGNVPSCFTKRTEVSLLLLLLLPPLLLVLPLLLLLLLLLFSLSFCIQFALHVFCTKDSRLIVFISCCSSDVWHPLHFTEFQHFASQFRPLLSFAAWEQSVNVCYYLALWPLQISALIPSFLLISYGIQLCRRWHSWMRHCATSRKVAGSIPDGSLEYFIDIILPAALWSWGWLNP